MEKNLEQYQKAAEQGHEEAQNLFSVGYIESKRGIVTKSLWLR